MNDLPANIEKAFQFLRKPLREIYGEKEGDALAREVLLDATGMDRSDFFLRKENSLKEEQWHRCTDAMQRLQKQEPLQYILGYTEFMDLEINLRPGVLIPRPETEEMVYYILQQHPLLKEEQKPTENKIPQEDIRILDLCTGSGCIALALASKLKPRSVLATDLSETALLTARQNAARYSLPVEFRKDDLLNTKIPDTEKFELITCNPPYVRESEKSAMQTNVLEWEPPEALFVPEEEPLNYYKALASFCETNLTLGGHVYMEINEALGRETADLFPANLYKTTVHKDLNGKDRFIEAKSIR